MTASQLQQLTLHVCETARRAAAFIRQERTHFSDDSIECKHAHDYVSYVDKGSERLIVDSLRELLPEAGFITEEGLASHHSETYCWVVDPLDGTTNFLHSYAPYAVSIALTRGDEILAGVVCEVTADECFYAWRGGGAYLDGMPIAVSHRTLDEALLCFQLPYNAEAYSATARSLIAQFYGRVASIRMIGSAAMALCYVAAGRLDGYAERYIGQWDFMAGAIIVSEAGGQLSDYSGTSRFFHGDSIVATNGLFHQQLLEAIGQAT